MGKLFGTDGIRGVANKYPMIPEIAVQVGRAVARTFSKNGQAPRIIIAKDTRASGPMLEHGLASGICSMGGVACLAGILPTPAVAFLASSMGFDAGIVISASHNPYMDNGIKLFNGDGYKLSDAVEAEVEKLILDYQSCLSLAENIGPGSVERIDDAADKYIDFAKQVVGKGVKLEGLNVVLDCSNGAMSDVAPAAFNSLDAAVTTIFNGPDGQNINLECGSQHPDVLAEQVIKINAHVGFAFDGDGDRVIAVDEKGFVITGDQILAICAAMMKDEGRLANDMVVCTVMSNLGLRSALSQLGIRFTITQVGDRYVLEEMLKTGARVGGEDSGHMIFLDHNTTGDGLVTALWLARAMKKTGKPLSELAKIMRVFPQRLVNIKVKSKPPIESIPELVAAINSVENALGDTGRVLVRYSGTQAMCRVMVEAPTDEETERHCAQIAKVVERALA